MTPPEATPEPSVDDYRILELEREMRELQRVIAPVALHDYRIGVLEDSFKDVVAALDRLRAVLVGFAITIAASATGLALTIALTN